MFRIAEGRCLGVDFVRSLTDICAAQDAEPFGVSGHHAILDAVMDHLDEMTGAVWAAVQIALLGCAADSFSSWRTRDVADAGRQRLENRVKSTDCIALSANHHA